MSTVNQLHFNSVLRLVCKKKHQQGLNVFSCKRTVCDDFHWDLKIIIASKKVDTKYVTDGLLSDQLLKLLSQLKI